MLVHVVALVTLDSCLARLHLVDSCDTGFEDAVLLVHVVMLVTLDFCYTSVEDLVLLDTRRRLCYKGLENFVWIDYTLSCSTTLVRPSITMGPEDAGTSDYFYIRPDFDLHEL